MQWMDGMANGKAGESGHPGFGTSPGVDRIGDALDSEGLYGRLAWPVAERMLQMLASSKAPQGFKPADFVKESFEDTFGRHLTSTDVDSVQQKGNSGIVLGNQGNSVVDAALGALGFKATTTCEREISILVSILTSLVQSKVSCGSYSLLPSAYPPPPGAFEGQRASQGDDILHRSLCCQSISTSGLLQMVESCTPFLVSGKANCTQVLEVVDALVRVAIEASVFTPHSDTFHAMYRKSGKEGQGRNCPGWALQSLIDHALDEKDVIYSKLQPCSRLCFWRLRPLCLKQDLSCLAREAMERPLLPLHTELCRREEWATLVACLALAPDVFVQAQHLLHTWFLSSGAMRLWELRAEMVAAVWDVLNRPSAWGFAEEVYLPPQHAFYRTSLRSFIPILRWAPTLSGLVKLVNLLGHMEKLNEGSDGSSAADPALNPVRLSVKKEEEDVSDGSDHTHYNSIWSLLMDFLPWLHFASRILFHRQRCPKNLPLNSLKEVPEKLTTEGDLEGSVSNIEGGARQTSFQQVAAKYLAWLMSPLDARSRRSDEQMLLQLSRSWDKVMEAVCNDSSSSPGPGIPNGEDPGSLQSAKEATLLNCQRCGASLSRVKRQKCEEPIDTPEVSRQRLYMSALDIWLADLQIKLGMASQRVQLEEVQDVDQKAVCKMDGVMGSKSERGGPAKCSMPDIDRKRILVMQSFLPLGALAESLPFCSSLQFVARLLQFVGCGGHQDQDKWPEAPACNSGCSGLHCQECCPIRSVRLSGPKRTEDQGGDGAEKGNALQLPDPKPPNWIPGAAAMFNFLDSMHDDDAFLWPETAQSGSETEEAKSKVYQSLAVTVSELVNEWGTAAFETQSSGGGVFQKGPSKECHHDVATLEDMRGRFCAWIGKLQLSPEVVRVCDCAREMLDVRIANVQSLLISS